MRFAVLVFPGSNCDSDCFNTLKEFEGAEVEYVWHQETDIDRFDAVILPGGFSYGDYLRPGAIARFSPVMGAVAKYADRGGLVLGICNGFQILCEAGLLPGALVRNASRRFHCEMRPIRVERNDTPFTNACADGETLLMPIAHAEGRYYADPETLARLEANRQVIFRYVDENGEATPAGNPNGSLANIAGISSERGNVVGLMPHPERNADTILGDGSGRKVLLSLARAVSGVERGQFVR